jgi:hypothetical protein
MNTMPFYLPIHPLLPPYGYNFSHNTHNTQLIEPTNNPIHNTFIALSD